MDIDIMQGTQESFGEQLYIGQGIQRLVYSGKYIHYNNISGPKTLMLAWKTLIRHHREFLQESKQFLRHLATQEAAQRADLLADVGGEQNDKEERNVQWKSPLTEEEDATLDMAMLLPEITSERTEAVGEDDGLDVLRCDWISTDRKSVV